MVLPSAFHSAWGGRTAAIPRGTADQCPRSRHRAPARYRTEAMAVRRLYTRPLGSASAARARGRERRPRLRQPVRERGGPAWRRGRGRADRRPGFTTSLCARRESVYLASGEQEAPGAVDLCLLRTCLSWPVVRVLNVPKFPIRSHRANQGRPTPPHDRPIVPVVEESGVDAPGERISEEGRTAGLGTRPAVRGEQARPPIAIRALEWGDRPRHLLKQRDEPWSLRVVLGQILQHTREAREHPAIAATPEHLGAVALAPAKDATVAVVKARVAIVEIGGRVPPQASHVIRVAPVTGRLGRQCQRGRRHEQRVAPHPCALGLLIVKLK